MCGNSVLGNRTMGSFLEEVGNFLAGGKVSWCLHTILGWLGKVEMCVSIKRVMQWGRQDVNGW